MKKIIMSILKKYWSYLLIAFLAVVIYFMFTLLKEKNAEISRKASNIEVLNTNYKNYKVAYTLKDKDGKKKDTTIMLSAAKVGSLTYKLDEFKRYKIEDAQTIKDMGLKLKNVLSVANVNTQIEQHITTPAIKTDTSTCFNYKDGFIELSGCIIDTTTDIGYKVKDKLLIIPSIVKKHHFLWFEWGVKGIQLDVLSKNPNASFTYASYIEIKK